MKAFLLLIALALLASGCGGSPTGHEVPPSRDESEALPPSSDPPTPDSRTEIPMH